MRQTKRMVSSSVQYDSIIFNVRYIHVYTKIEFDDSNHGRFVLNGNSGYLNPEDCILNYDDKVKYCFQLILFRFGPPVICEQKGNDTETRQTKNRNRELVCDINDEAKVVEKGKRICLIAIFIMDDPYGL
ncbi:hypothetical protein BLOT_006575 [Blomia tropicalis]|nr:hypothetical protein BLOT_006575 [Blomia tropicalis]